MTVKRLTDEEIAELRKHLLFPHLTHRIEASIPRLLDEVETSRTLLRRIEWIAGPVAWNCPACGGAKDRNGHAPDCELAALIGKAPLPKSADRP